MWPVPPCGPLHQPRRALCIILSMATQQRQAASYKEGRLDLAVQAYLQGKFRSYTAAVNAYDVSRKTLQRRIAGKQSKRGSIATNRLLTSTEEASLLQWILSMD